MARRYRPRKEFKFWLYHDLDSDRSLMDYIQYLRQTRQFARAVRDGLRLLWSLREGDLTVLFELFPTLRHQFQPDTDALIEQFRQLLVQHSPALPLEQGRSKALPAPQFALPLLADDEQETVIIKRDTSTDAAMNFFNSMMKLQQ